MSYNQGYIISLELKRLFISFAQALFSEHPKYTWEYDVRTSKIFIIDRNSTDLGVAIKRPLIVFQRGPLSWTMLNRGQSGFNAADFQREGLKPYHGNDVTASHLSTYHYTDLVEGSAVYHVLSKSGVEAEMIADILFQAFVAYKPEFRETNIFKITSISMGSEAPIKASVEYELIGVPIQFSFLTQQTVSRKQENYKADVLISGEGAYEGLDYSVITNGTQIEFLRDFSDGEQASDISVTYVDAITLEEATVTPVATGNPKVFTIPNSKSIAGYYNLFNAMTITSTPPIDANDYEEFEETETQV